MTDKNSLRRVREESRKQVESWPKWRQDAGERWIAQLKKDNEIERNNLKGWGPFDQ